MSQAGETAYCFPVPEAARLASLIGLKSDLEQVLAYCDRMIERYLGPHLKKSPFDIVGFTTPVDFLDWEALSTAACVSYARCFLSGVRQSLDNNLLRTAEPEFNTLHDFVMGFRNKHIAHSVNSFEENTVTVHLGDNFQSSQEIETVTPSHTRAAGLAFDIPAKLKRLAQWWLRKVDEEMSVEKANVLRAARATLLSDLEAYGTPKSRSAEDRRADVGKRRPNP